MKVAWMSMFHDAMPLLIERPLDQLDDLMDYSPHDEFVPVFGEGDSSDGEETWRFLNHEFPGHIHKCEHGGKVYGSVDVKERWIQLSKIWNQLLEFVPADADAAVYVEADLIWKPATMVRLLELINTGLDIVGPMCMHRDEQHYYDTWGTRADGTNFSYPPPFHPVLALTRPDGLCPVDAIGSCWAMSGEVARTCRFKYPELDTVGFMQDARERGWQPYIDTTVKVFHP